MMAGTLFRQGCRTLQRPECDYRVRAIHRRGFMIPRALWMLSLLSFTAFSAPMPPRADDFSARIDALWNYADPAASAQRFRAERARCAGHTRETLEIDTQLARTMGLARQFDDAHRLLDKVEAQLDDVDVRVRVRYLLERGRTFNSSGNGPHALALFGAAYVQSQAAGRPGDAFYTIDALHMLAIASPPAEQLAWNEKALAAADAASDPRARNWRGSLMHNLGWTYFDAGDYATALDYWRRALALREAAGDVARIRVAKWTVARGLRAQGHLDEAEAMQRTLAGELAQANAPDGYVFEELTEIAVARGDPAAARTWAAQALPLLRADADLAANEPGRLARIAQLAGQTP
jgi:tetratricopeptide (TPR) repeat protein